MRREHQAPRTVQRKGQPRMTDRRKLTLSLLACLLAFAASGDDFCFARLVFLPESAQESLPLDDPNTDFVASSESPSVRRQARDARVRWSETRPSGWRWPATAGWCPFQCAPTARHGHPSFSALNSPLLC
jgi:hypothetical protein